jgi:small subunit ribosomal protein S4
VRHSHFNVNGRRVNIPSFLVKQGDLIELREKSRKIPGLVESIDQATRRGFPNWLEVDPGAFKARVASFPTRDEIPMDLQEQLIVELYSK